MQPVPEHPLRGGPSAVHQQELTALKPALCEHRMVRMPIKDWADPRDVAYRRYKKKLAPNMPPPPVQAQPEQLIQRVESAVLAAPTACWSEAQPPGTRMATGWLGMTSAGTGCTTLLARAAQLLSCSAPDGRSSDGRSSDGRSSDGRLG